MFIGRHRTFVKMNIKPLDFTYEELSRLKFKDLQKLAVQFHVSKRWAKKQELIQNLLALKNKGDFIDDKPKDNLNFEDSDWKDSSTIFQNLELQCQNNVIDRRLTFKIDKKSSLNGVDSHSTFETFHNSINKGIKDDKEINSKETYDILPLDFHLTTDVDPRATFKISPKSHLLNDVIDPRGTFKISPKNQLLDDGIDPRATFNVPKAQVNKVLQECANDINDKGYKHANFNVSKSNFNEPTQINLTENVSTEKKLLQKKSKLNHVKPESIRRPQIKISATPVSKRYNRQTEIQHMKSTERKNNIEPSKIPTKLQKINEVYTVTKRNENKNHQMVLRNKNHKNTNSISNNLNTPKVVFMSPATIKNKNNQLKCFLTKTSFNKDAPKNCTIIKDSKHSQTPKITSNVTVKPLKATKMPDFNKIHKKHFNEMDSLHDYLRKKEERTRKLFGIPPFENQVSKNVGSPVQFKFSTSENSENNYNKISGTLGKNTRIPLKNKLKAFKITQKEAFIKKVPPHTSQSSIKDKNRSHIQGVRTNKRFELQMKFRNL